MDPALTLKRAYLETESEQHGSRNNKRVRSHHHETARTDWPSNTTDKRNTSVDTHGTHQLSFLASQAESLVGSVDANDLLSKLQAFSESAMADAAAARAERQYLLNEIAFEKDLLREARNEAEEELNSVRDAFMENRMALKRSSAEAREIGSRDLTRHEIEMEHNQIEILDLETEQRHLLTEKYHLQKSVDMKESLLQGELRMQKFLSSQVRQYEMDQNACKKRTSKLTALLQTRQEAHEEKLAVKDAAIQQLQTEIDRVNAEIRANPNLRQNISKSQTLLETEISNVSARFTTLQGTFAEQLQRKTRLESQLKHTWKKIYLEREAYASNIVEITELHEDQQDLNVYFVRKDEHERAMADKNNQDMQSLLDSFKS